MILKSLIRTYFLNLAIETAFERIWFNFMVPEIDKKSMTIRQQYMLLMEMYRKAISDKTNEKYFLDWYNAQK